MAFSVRRNLAWMAASQAGLFVIQFASSLIVARLLTPYEMGVFAVATAVAGLIGIIRSIGLSSYLVRAKTIDEAMLASVFTVNAVIAVFTAAVIAGISVLGGVLLGEAGVRHVLLVMAAVPLLGIFELLPATGIERAGDFRAVGVLNFGRILFATVVLLGFAFSGYSYMSLAYAQVAGAGFSVVALNVIGRRHVRFRFGLHDWRGITRYGFQILAISGVNVLSARLAEVLLARLLGLGALGLYSRATGLNSLLWDNVHVVLARVVFVDFSDQKRRGGSLRHSYLRIVQMITALLWPAFTGMAVLAGPITLMLYGPTWIGAAWPLSLLSLSAVVLVSITMTWEVFVVCEETGRQARFEFARAGFGFVLFVGGCLLSLGWAAAARIGEALIAVILYRPHLERMTDTTGRDFVPIYASSLLLTLAAVGPAAAVMSLHGWQAETPLMAVFGSVAAGIVCWAVLLVATRHPLAREGRLLLARALPGRFGLSAD